jgi:hypothetical protein
MESPVDVGLVCIQGSDWLKHLAFSVPIDDVVEPTPIFRFPCRGIGQKVRVR